MKNTIKLFALTMLAGCSTLKPEPLPLPAGNMPMTEQEYQEAELFLLKKQKLPPDEHLKHRNETPVR
ncbi:MAG: hypothetical protein ACRESJ_22355 [Pseudomonas sp.]|uniref:hypothetical protein n=1 Tax=Pseudomonas sp. TaxID=306 RepID=UPI003D6F0E13